MSDRLRIYTDLHIWRRKVGTASHTRTFVLVKSSLSPDPPACHTTRLR
jgi:hypothetical protein